VREGADLLGVLDHPVVAVGDLATAEGTVAAAIGSGRRAALHLHRTFVGGPEAAGTAFGDLPDAPHRGRHTADVLRDEVIRADHLKLDRFDVAPSRRGREADPGARTADFREIHEGLPDTAEARRCLSCGVCNGCDLCVTWCPEGVLKRVDGELVFDYAYCKGCGICVTECPRAVVFMSEL
jgi:ferredoxin